MRFSRITLIALSLSLVATPQQTRCTSIAQEMANLGKITAISIAGGAVTASLIAGIGYAAAKSLSGN